jgi:hypothetical protein
MGIKTIDYGNSEARPPSKISNFTMLLIYCLINKFSTTKSIRKPIIFAPISSFKILNYLDLQKKQEKQIKSIWH